jgi:hypothetical protein
MKSYGSAKAAAAAAVAEEEVVLEEVVLEEAARVVAEEVARRAAVVEGTFKSACHFLPATSFDDRVSNIWSLVAAAHPATTRVAGQRPAAARHLDLAEDSTMVVVLDNLTLPARKAPVVSPPSFSGALRLAV